MSKAMTYVKQVSMTRPVAKTASFTSGNLDMQDVTSNKIDITVGVITDGTHTPTLYECATSGGTFTAVAAGDMVGSLAALASNTNQQVSYIGKLEFVQVQMVISGASTGGVYSIGAQVTYRKQN